MREVDINELLEYVYCGDYISDYYNSDRVNVLDKNIPNDIIIVGEIDKLKIEYEYDQLDLSRVDCDEIEYYDQESESIKNHILPKSLKLLDCDDNQLTSLPDLPNSLEILYCRNNQLTSLPKLPNSLKELNCFNNRLTSLPQLPNSLQELNCFDNQLTSLPDLPNSLKELYCSNNQLTLLPNLPNSLQKLYCSDNQLTLLPDLPDSLKQIYCDNNQLTLLPDFSHIDHELELSFNQDLPITYISYNLNLRLCKNIYNEVNKMNIEGYPHNPITNQKELDQYMDYQFYKMNRIKSARK